MSDIFEQQVNQARGMVAAARAAYNPSLPDEGENGARLTVLVKALMWLDGACAAAANAYGGYGASAADRVRAVSYKDEAKKAGREAYRLDPTPRIARGAIEHRSRKTWDDFKQEEYDRERRRHSPSGGEWRPDYEARANVRIADNERHKRMDALAGPIEAAMRLATEDIMARDFDRSDCVAIACAVAALRAEVWAEAFSRMAPDDVRLVRCRADSCGAGPESRYLRGEHTSVVRRTVDHVISVATSADPDVAAKRDARRAAIAAWCAEPTAERLADVTAALLAESPMFWGRPWLDQEPAAKWWRPVAD